MAALLVAGVACSPSSSGDARSGGGGAPGTGGAASGSGGNGAFGSGGSTARPDGGSDGGSLGGATAGTGGRGGNGGAATGTGGAIVGAGTGGSGGGAGHAAGSGGVTGSGGAGGAAAATKCTASDAQVGAYYVDSAAGHDTADGRTPGTAWQTLAKANGVTFQAGNALCLKAGSTFTGQLAPKGSGTSSAPIVVDQYGTGNKPRIAAAAGDLETVLLLNVQYWELNNLEVTNDQGGPGDYRGIAVRGRDAGVLNHIYIRGSFVHDVTGEVDWIGGDTADNQPPWVTFQTGWDASKRTGGIVFEVQSQNGTRTWFNDVLVEGNVIQDTSFGGIVFKQLDGGYGWGVRSSRTDARFTPHTNVVLRGNYLSQTGTKYGCNAIYLTGSQHVVVERNVTKDAGTSAIEIYNSDDVRVQYNETFGTVKKAGGADSNGIDADRASTGAVIQYNYIHDNGDGILLCQIAFGDSIVRYNLIVNNSRHGINLHSDMASTNQTYNNLIFIDGLGSANLIATSGSSDLLAASYVIRNNILHSTRAAAMVVTGSGVSYSNNLFSGVAAVGSAAQTGSAMFVNSAARPSGTQAGPAPASTLAGLQVRSTSAAVNNGVAISGNGGVDFWGDPLYSGAPDIGPYEAP